MNEPSRYADVAKGRAHIADLIAKLKASRHRKKMVVVVTYHESGGFFGSRRAAEG